MEDIKRKLRKLGLAVPDILLPREADLRQWAVIACDQFTQDRSYWEKAAEAAAGSPSTLNMIFPEAYLADTDGERRIGDIHQVMRQYLDDGVFAAPRRGFVYLERDTPYSRGRKGLIAAIDLEQYNWEPAARLLVRSTEDTVPERLPPRMNIRRNAPVEVPHILLLIDDDDDSLLRETGERAKKHAPAYQGDLMMNSGCVSGWFFDEADDWNFFAEGLEALARRSLTRYSGGGQPFLFAVGDGNHSLASAREIWGERKTMHNITGCSGKTSALYAMPNDPCRFALVEIENIHDPAIRFEPIHRIVFGLDFDSVLRLLAALPGFSCRMVTGREELSRLTAEPAAEPGGNRFGITAGDHYALVETSAAGIATVCLKPLLDKAALADGSVSIDYIHGEDELFRLAAGSARAVTGILLPPVHKSGFFDTVARCGPLPRKSFSMGEAWEKRFYIESRKLRDSHEDLMIFPEDYSNIMKAPFC